MAIELEDVINHLTGPQRLPIKDIYERLGLTRGLFQSRRRSSDPKKRSKLGEEIIAAYPEYFPDGVAPSSNTTGKEDMAGFGMRLVTMLEKNLEELKKERDELKEQNAHLLTQIEEMVRQVRDKVVG